MRKKISANMVPRILTGDQRQHRLHISSDLSHNAEMLDGMNTGDEMLCFQYDPVTKRKSRKKECVSLAAEDRACVFLRFTMNSVHTDKP
jgi:hypothetical protein